MSTPMNPRREHPSTYFVQDQSNQDEFTRLRVQDHLITSSMGGVLPEQEDATIFQRVLDVGCGTGDWLIETAKTYPSMSLLMGVDVNSRMIEQAQARAEVEGVSDRVQFRTMDALRMLEFPNDYFYLVNQRFNGAYLRTWDWPKLLQEYQRMLRPDGVIRITESDNSEANSPAFKSISDLLLETFYLAGHVFISGKNGPASELERLLQQYGFLNVQTRDYLLEYRGGTPEGHIFYEDMKHLFKTAVPFLRKWTRVPENYEELYQESLKEMQQPNFEVKWRIRTAWGNKPLE